MFREGCSGSWLAVGTPVQGLLAGRSTCCPHFLYGWLACSHPGRVSSLEGANFTLLVEKLFRGSLGRALALGSSKNVSQN